MGIQVTLDVPENIYQEVAQLAQETQSEIDDVLEEIVIRSFPPLYVSPDQPKMLREVAAFEAMHPELWEKYPNEFVAVYQGKVIDHDLDEMVLVDRVHETYPNEVITVDKVLPQLQREIIFRSPRYSFGL
jgi:hypothetical protein